MKRVLLPLILLGLLAGGGFYYWQGAQAPTTIFRTAPVTRGDLVVTISATGTVEPIEVVDVGAQVAGKITEFGHDPKDPTKVIDYGTEVEKGTVLARIDDSLYAAEVAQARAQVEQNKANVRRAEADLLQMKAKLAQAENNWKRARELGPSRALSAIEYDNYEATYKTALATVAVGEATLEQAKKSVLQAEATLQRAETNLGYCIIKSPVKGVIIDRRVNIGQTVVASLNAPSLFLIAKDLRKLQVWVAVNEADIGSIRPGQNVTFTVDVYPGRTFYGTVGKIRLNATMTQNVVTYTVEVETDNSDGQLLPYLTANVRFEVHTLKDVLTVPNAALRWRPEPQLIAPDARSQVDASGAFGGRPGGGPGRPSGGPEAGRGPGQATGNKPPAPQQTRGRVWVRDGDYVRPVSVIVGPTDNTVTQIETDALKEGDEVVIGDVEQVVVQSTTNPFTPQFRRRR